jgi:hypothetical protein
MKIQIDIDERTNELLEAHRKMFFPHLKSKRAYLVEIVRQRAERDMEEKRK